MRLKRFELTRYGHFTDQTLDFGSERPVSDLHVVYGPNEAGKSTLLEAVSDLLYGMPRRSSQAHLHDYKSLELRASLMQGDTPLDIRRFKRSLTDDAGAVLDINAIDLHGLSREAFMSRFSFNSQALEAGSATMLANEGDLGEALFSASAGIPDIQRRLDTLMEASLRFYEPNKTRDKQLPGLLQELKEIDAQLKARDIQTPAWKRLRETAGSALADLQEAENTLAGVTGQLVKRQRQASAFGRARRLRAARETLSEHSDIPALPSAWLGRLRELRPIVIGLEATLAERRQRLNDLTRSLSEDSPDEHLLPLEERVHELQGMQALVREQADRLAELDDDIADSERQILSARHDMQMPDDLSTETSILSSTQLAVIDRLTREHQALFADGQRTHDTLNRIDVDLALLADGAEPALDLSVLHSRLRALRGEGFGGELARLDNDQRDAENAVDDAMASLRPWHGSADALSELSIPDEQEQHRIEHMLATANDYRSTLDTRIEQTSTRIAEFKRNRSKTVDGRPIDDDHAVHVKEQRDAAWRDHLISLDDASTDRLTLQKTARDFAVLLSDVDSLADRRLRESDRVGRLRSLDNDIAELEREIETFSEQRKDADRDVDAARRAVSDLAGRLSLPGDLAMESISSWLQRREQAMRCLSEARRLIALRAETLSRRESLKTSLHETLDAFVAFDTKSVPRDVSFDELLDVAENRLQRLTSDRESRQRLERERQLAELDRQKQAQSEQEWKQRWDKALAGSWLVGRDAAAIADLLEPLRQLDRHRTMLAELQSEQARLRSSVQRHDASIQALLQEANAQDVANTESPVLDRAALQSALLQLGTDVRHASELAARHQEIAGEKATLTQDIVERERELLPSSSVLAEMMERCAVDDLAQLDAKLEHVQLLKATEAEAAALGQELTEALDVDSVDEALGELDALDRDEIDADIARLSSEADHLGNVRDEMRLNASRANDAMSQVDGDEQLVHLTTRRANILLEIRERSADTLRMRLGREALLEGVRRYRDQHRSDMLTQASESFVALTLGRYRDLQTQPDGKGNEQLRAITADGRSLDTKQLSDGTRFQLFLALRIAAFHAYAVHRTPPPFIADDVMESFDEDRTAAAFSLFASMARSGQIIYLTHQYRVVEIARRVVGKDVRIHELPGRT